MVVGQRAIIVDFEIEGGMMVGQGGGGAIWWVLEVEEAIW